MRKVLILLLVFTLFTIGMKPQDVHADMGPKPSIQITIKGVDTPYSFDLITPYEDLEAMTYTENQGYVDDESYYKDDYPDSLILFQDRDNFSSYHRYNGIGAIRQESEHVFNANYHGPKTYKIVLVTEDNQFIISKQVVNLIFDTVVTWDLTGVDLSESSYDLGELSGNMGIGTLDNHTGGGQIVWMTVWRTITRVIATIFIELVVFLFIFRYREKDTFKKMIVVNVISQTVLSALLVIGYMQSNFFGFFGTLIFGEFLVFLGEAVLFTYWFKEGSKTKAFWFAIAANTASLWVSIFITTLIS